MRIYAYRGSHYRLPYTLDLPVNIGYFKNQINTTLNPNQGETMTTPSKEAQQQIGQNEKKWTPTLMKAGWTVLPSVILDRQKAFGLDAVDINILLHLAKYWWYSDNPPHPSKQAIADCMDVDKSTIRRRIARMEKDGLIKRQARYDTKTGQQTNSYHFDGLINAAKPFAKEAVEAREQQKTETAKRRTRKLPVKTQESKEG